MTQEYSPSAEDAWEVEENKEASEEVSEPKVAPTIRTTVHPSSRETVRTWKAAHLTAVNTRKQRSTFQRLIGSLNTLDQNTSMDVTFAAHLRMKFGSPSHIW